MPVSNGSVKAYSGTGCASTCDVIDTSPYVTLDVNNKPSTYATRIAQEGAKSIQTTATVNNTTTTTCYNARAARGRAVGRRGPPLLTPPPAPQVAISWTTTAVPASNVANCSALQAGAYGECWSGGDCKGTLISDTTKYNDSATWARLCDRNFGGDSIAVVETVNGATSKNCYAVAPSVTLTKVALDEETNLVDEGEGWALDEGDVEAEVLEACLAADLEAGALSAAEAEAAYLPAC